MTHTSQLTEERLREIIRDEVSRAALLNSPSRPLTAPEAASYCGLSVSGVYYLSEKLGGYRRGKRLFFRKADLDRYLLNSNAKGGGE